MQIWKEHHDPITGNHVSFVSEDGCTSFTRTSEAGVALQAQIDAEEVTLSPWAEPVKTWQEKRQASVGAGGYGLVTEQLEILGEQGLDAFQQHIADVKAAHPKE